MSDFSKFVSISPLPDGRWITYSDMPFDLVHGDESTRVLVKAGFKTDGATVPTLGRLFVDRGDSRILKAAILHDWLLWTKAYTPRQSSDAFFDALISASIPKWKANLMWLSVYWRATTKKLKGK